MTHDLRAVFDFNVVVSAMLLPESVLRRAIDRVLREGRLLISIAAMTEFVALP